MRPRERVMLSENSDAMRVRFERATNNPRHPKVRGAERRASKDADSLGP
jgi:hypothetical protein